MSFKVAELVAFDRLAPLAFGALMLFFALETWRPLRARVEPRTARVLRNASMGVLGAGVVRIAVVTTTFGIAEHAQTERIGLLPTLEGFGVPRSVILVLGFL